jgi:CheY-like chemotaxis protein
VLAVGFDSSLMTNRIPALQSAGCIVVRASSLKESIDCFQSGDFDLVMLCHSVPSTDRERLTALIRASGSKTPIVSIAGSRGECDAFVNATLEDNPNEFVVGIRDALIRAAKARAGRTAK